MNDCCTRLLKERLKLDSGYESQGRRVWVRERNQGTKEEAQY
jgi:hypothetical protein